MPRKRVNLGLKQRYSHEALVQAVEDVRKKKYTMRKASEIYKVPLSTLCDNVNGKSQSNKIGAKPKLTPQTEQLLADYFAKLVQGGFSLTYNHVQRIISDFLVKYNLSHLFKNGCPGRDWYYEFKKRWRHKLEGFELATTSAPSASSRVEDVAFSGSDQEPRKLSDPYNDKFKSFLAALTKHYASFDYAAHPENVWAMDEISLTLELNSTEGYSRSMLLQKPNKSNQQDLDNKNRFTLVSCTNAAGDHLPPFVVYKSKFARHDKLVNNSRLPNSIFCSSLSGWMETDQLMSWFRESFLEHVRDIEGPKLLFVDSAATALSIDLVDMASQFDVHLISTPTPLASLTPILNPIEVGVHRHARNIWKKILEKYVLKTKASLVNRNHLPYLISKLFEKAFSKAYCSNGFVKSGLYPLDCDKILPKSSLPPQFDYPVQTSPLSLIKVREELPSESIETEVISGLEAKPGDERTDSPTSEKQIDVDGPDQNEEARSLSIQLPPAPPLIPAPIETTPLVLASPVFSQNTLELLSFRSNVLERIERLNAEAMNIQSQILHFFDSQQLMMPMMSMLSMSAASALANMLTIRNEAAAVALPPPQHPLLARTTSKRALEITHDEILIENRKRIRVCSDGQNLVSNANQRPPLPTFF